MQIAQEQDCWQPTRCGKGSRDVLPPDLTELVITDRFWKLGVTATFSTHWWAKYSPIVKQTLNHTDGHGQSMCQKQKHDYEKAFYRAEGQRLEQSEYTVHMQTRCGGVHL